MCNSEFLCYSLYLADPLISLTLHSFLATSTSVHEYWSSLWYTVLLILTAFQNYLDHYLVIIPSCTYHYHLVRSSLYWLDEELIPEEAESRDGRGCSGMILLNLGCLVRAKTDTYWSEISVPYPLRDSVDTFHDNVVEGCDSTHGFFT